jgi:hypothetical protein
VVALGIAADGQRPSIRRVTKRLRCLRLSLQNPRLRAVYRHVRSELVGEYGEVEAKVSPCADVAAQC